MTTSDDRWDGPRIGDDGFSPGARGWMATPLAIMLWSAIFTAVFFATRDPSIEGLGAVGYIELLFIAFVLTVFFIIPSATLLFGPMIDDVAAGMNAVGRVLLSVLAGGVVGAIPGAFIYFVNTDYGYQPLTQFIVPSALAGIITWWLVPPCLKWPPLRTAFVTLAVVVLVGSLTTGVLVMTGRV